VAILSFLFGSVALVVVGPIAMWFKTWPEALSRWLPHVVGIQHISQGQFRDVVLPRFQAEGPPRAVRFAALGCWILGGMFIPGLLLGLYGLLMLGLGLVSIPGLLLAWRLFFLGRPLLLGDAAAAAKARALARNARTLNYVVLAVCGAGVLVKMPGLVRSTHADLSGLLLAMAVAVYAGISLAHASLLDRAAKAIDEEEDTRQAVLRGVRIAVPMVEEMPGEMSEEMSEEIRRGRRG
jgi:hypothetical protein